MKKENELLKTIEKNFKTILLEKGIYFVEMGSGEKLAEKIKKIANIGR